MIKNYCVSCGEKINIEDYKENGNYCYECCIKASITAKARIGNEQAIKKLKERYNETVGKDDLKEIKEILIWN